MKLRRLGLTIAMSREKHDGQVPGWHGRYTILTPIELLSDQREAA
jgi:hypothetical protein